MRPRSQHLERALPGCLGRRQLVDIRAESRRLAHAPHIVGTMPETFDEYRHRILSYLGDRNPLSVQRNTPRIIAKLINGLPRRTQRWRPGPSQWSILEIIGHMADAELAMGWRVRNMIATPGVSLTWFNQDEWAVRLRYNDGSIREYLALFTGLRRSNLQLLNAFTPRQLRARYGVHEVRGRQNVWDFVRLEAGHDLSHIRQIRKVLAAHRARNVRRSSRER